MHAISIDCCYIKSFDTVILWLQCWLTWRTHKTFEARCCFWHIFLNNINSAIHDRQIKVSPYDLMHFFDFIISAKSFFLETPGTLWFSVNQPHTFAVICICASFRLSLRSLTSFSYFWSRAYFHIKRIYLPAMRNLSLCDLYFTWWSRKWRRCTVYFMPGSRSPISYEQYRFTKL